MPFDPKLLAAVHTTAEAARKANALQFDAEEALMLASKEVMAEAVATGTLMDLVHSLPSGFLRSELRELHTQTPVESNGLDHKVLMTECIVVNEDNGSYVSLTEIQEP